jgi:hypothetical protein
MNLDAILGILALVIVVSGVVMVVQGARSMEEMGRKK